MGQIYTHDHDSGIFEFTQATGSSTMVWGGNYAASSEPPPLVWCPQCRLHRYGPCTWGQGPDVDALRIAPDCFLDERTSEDDGWIETIVGPRS